MEKFFRSNLFAWFLALLVAISLWLFVMADNITRTTPARKELRLVPLTVENLSGGLTITEIPETVSAIVEGLPEAFEGLSVDELEAYIDATDKGAGSHQLRVRGNVPRGLNLISFSPREVSVTIEQLDSAAFQVEAELQGDPAEGWIRKDHSLDPTDVLVEAPRSVFEQIDRIVVRLDQSGLSGQHRQHLFPLAVDRNGLTITDVKLVPDRIAVTISFARIDEEAP